MATYSNNINIVMCKHPFLLFVESMHLCTLSYSLYCTDFSFATAFPCSTGMGHMFLGLTAAWALDYLFIETGSASTVGP